MKVKMEKGNVIIYSDDLDGEIGVAINEPSFAYKYTLEVKNQTLAILSLEEGQFGLARDLLRKEFS